MAFLLALALLLCPGCVVDGCWVEDTYWCVPEEVQPQQQHRLLLPLVLVATALLCGDCVNATMKPWCETHTCTAIEYETGVVQWT